MYVLEYPRNSSLVVRPQSGLGGTEQQRLGFEQDPEPVMDRIADLKRQVDELAGGSTAVVDQGEHVTR